MELLERGGVVLVFAFFVYPVTCLFHTVGLYRLFPGGVRSSLSFLRLYETRMAGDAVNNMTPFVDVGGEPLKIALIRERRIARLDEAVPAVYAARICLGLAELLFVLSGLILLFSIHPSSFITVIVVAGLLFMFLFLFVMMLGQTGGVLQSLANGIRRLIRANPGDGEDGLWVMIESKLRSLYRDRRMDFIMSVFWHFVGLSFSALEVYFALWILGLPVTAVESFVIQSLLQAIRTASFFIPDNLGAQEGGLAYLTNHLGLGVTGGFAVSLVKRARKLLWILVGLGLWGWGKRVMEKTDAKVEVLHA